MQPSLSQKTVSPPTASFWLTLLLSALAGGMAWGIRGQYGHETGAMMAGVLIGYALILSCCPQLSSLQAARAVALLTVGISFGGQQTYGQVLGLTQDKELIGNWNTLAWGMLGTFVIGGNWAGLGGLFFGIGLSGKKYSPWEMLGLALGMIALIFVGHALLNLPFDPASHKLPAIYFSDNWSWEIRKEAAWKPRPEIWGGLLLAWVGLMAYVEFVKKDRLARNIGLAGYLAGIGFPIGQSIQAGNAWNPDLFKFLCGSTHQFVNWWNMMEITFGTVIGLVLAIGLRLNLHLIQREESRGNLPQIPIPSFIELIFVLFHLWLLVGSEFLLGEKLFGYPIYPIVASLTAGLGIIPLVGIIGGRWWPYLFPLTMVPVTICGKTWLGFEEAFPKFPQELGLILIVSIPLILGILIAFYFSTRQDRDSTSTSFATIGLLWSGWLFFALNTVFFQFPFDLTKWGGRTHSQLIYDFQILCITLITLSLYTRHQTRPTSPL